MGTQASILNANENNSLDRAYGYVFMSEYGNIVRKNIDGSNPVIIVSEVIPEELTVDEENNYIYWISGLLKDKIQRIKIKHDGSEAISEIEDFFEGEALVSPKNLDLDTDAGYLYWDNSYDNDVLLRSRLDSPETVEELKFGKWTKFNIDDDLINNM